MCNGTVETVAVGGDFLDAEAKGGEEGKDLAHLQVSQRDDAFLGKRPGSLLLCFSAGAVTSRLRKCAKNSTYHPSPLYSRPPSLLSYLSAFRSFFRLALSRFRATFSAAVAPPSSSSSLPPSPSFPLPSPPSWRPFFDPEVRGANLTSLLSNPPPFPPSFLEVDAISGRLITVRGTKAAHNSGRSVHLLYSQPLYLYLLPLYLPPFGAAANFPSSRA